MKNNNQQLGMVDNLAVDPSIAQTQRHLEADSRPPVDAQAPSINPLAYESNTENLSTPRAGTILSSTTFNISDSGIQKVHEYSHNSSRQAELRMKLEEQRARQTGRSIYQTPVTQGVSVTPNVDDGERPDPAKLEELRQQERYSNLKRRVQNLRLQEQQMASKLNSTRRVITELQAELEELEN